MTRQDLVFLLSLFLSRLADQMLLFLVPLVIFQLTHNISWSGMAFFIETLPRFIAFPVSGVLCDHYPLMTLLRLSQRLRAACVLLGLGIFMLSGGVIWLALLSGVIGIFFTLGFMARDMMLPRLFSHTRFEQTLAYAQMADQVGMVLGPVVAGLILAIASWKVVIIAISVLFMLSDVALQRWEQSRRPVLQVSNNGPVSWSQSTRQAWQHIVRRPGLLPLIILAASINLALGVCLSTSAAMVTGVLHAGNDSYSLLQAAGAFATVVILLFITHVAIPLAGMGTAGFTLIAAGSLLMGVSSRLAGYALGFVLMVGFDKMFSVFIRSLRQRLIPLQDMGKTSGMVVLLNNLTQPLAGLLVGVQASHHSISQIILLSTTCMLLLGVFATGLWYKYQQ